MKNKVIVPMELFQHSIILVGNLQQITLVIVRVIIQEQNVIYILRREQKR